MTPRRSLLVLFAVSLLALPAAGAKKPQILETRELSAAGPESFDIAAGSTLAVKGVAGEITVVRGEGPQAVVTIERAAGGEEPRFEMLRHAEGITVCAVHPSPNPKKPNECLPGKKGRLAQGNVKTIPDVRFKVALPDGVHFMGMLQKGSIDARAGRSNLDLDMGLGDIRVLDGGSQVIQTNARVGSTDAVLAGESMLPEKRVVRFESLSGDILVTVPPALPIYYAISAEKPIVSAFTLEEPNGPVRLGHLGPHGDAAMNLSISTSMTGKITLRATR